MAEKKWNFKSALSAWIKTKDEDAKAWLLANDKRVFVVENDKIDAAQTLDLFEVAHLQISDDAKTFAEVLADASKTYEACPITGGILVKGKTITRPVLDWSGIPEQRRMLGAFAWRTKDRPDGGDPEMAVAELRKPVLDHPKWERLERDFAKVQASTQKFDRAIVESCREALVFKKEAAIKPAPFVAEPAHEQAYSKSCAAFGGISCKGYRGPCAGPGEMGECGNLIPMPAAPAPPQAGAPLIVILYADEDRRYVDEFRKAMAQLCRQGVQVWDRSEVRPGARIADQIAAKMATARIVLHMVSADYLAQDPQKAIGAINIPILLRHAMLDGWLAAAVALPRNGQAISKWSDRDSAWCDVVAGIRAVLNL